MVMNLFTSLFISVGIGLTCFRSNTNNDKNITIDEPSNVFVDVDGNLYLEDGVYSTSSISNSLLEQVVINQSNTFYLLDYFDFSLCYYEFKPSVDGFIVGDSVVLENVQGNEIYTFERHDKYWVTSPDSSLFGNHVSYFDFLRFYFTINYQRDISFDDGTNYRYNIVCHTAIQGRFYNVNTSQYDWFDLTNSSVANIICYNLRYVSSSFYANYQPISPLSFTHHTKSFYDGKFSDTLEYNYLSDTSFVSSDNLHFNNSKVIDLPYLFTNSFQPWLSITYPYQNSYKFGTPSDTSEWAPRVAQTSYNYRRTLEEDSDNYFYTNFVSNVDGYCLIGIDLFEGLFTYYNRPYTNISLYFYTYWNPDSDEYTSAPYNILRFAYLSFYNVISNESIQIIGTNNYWNYFGGGSLVATSLSRYVGNYNINIPPFDNSFEGSDSSRAHCLFLPQFYYTQGYPRINVLYACNRVSLNDWTDVRLSYNYKDLLDYSLYQTSNLPSYDDGLGNILSVFDLISLAFAGLGSFISLEVLPGITLGVLLFTPLLFVIILAIINLFKR